jgi:hypothetical protein
MGGKRDTYKILVQKHLVKYPLGRLRRREEDNIKLDLTEIGCENG